MDWRYALPGPLRLAVTILSLYLFNNFSQRLENVKNSIDQDSK